MARCCFCDAELRPSQGLLFVKKEGKAVWFCSKKCELNSLKLKRKPQNLKWITSKK